MVSYRNLNGDRTTYTYNNVGRLKNVTNADGTYVEYDYYKDGSLKSVTTNFGKTEYAYDNLGRLSTVNDNNVCDFSNRIIVDEMTIVSPEGLREEYKKRAAQVAEM